MFFFLVLLFPKQWWFNSQNFYVSQRRDEKNYSSCTSNYYYTILIYVCICICIYIRILAHMRTNNFLYWTKKKILFWFTTKVLSDVHIINEDIRLSQKEMFSTLCFGLDERHIIFRAQFFGWMGKVSEDNIFFWFIIIHSWMSMTENFSSNRSFCSLNNFSSSYASCRW